MKHTLILTSFLLLFSLSKLQAQTESEDITDRFFQLFEKEPLQAMDYAFATNPYLLTDTLAIETLKNKYSKATHVTGVYQGFEKIIEKSIGKSYKICSFLVRYQRIPLRFTFVFYRAQETWRVNQLYYDSNLLAELEASAKQDRI